EDGNEAYNTFQQNFMAGARGLGGNGSVGEDGSGMWVRGPLNRIKDNVCVNAIGTETGNINGTCYNLMFASDQNNPPLTAIRIPLFPGADTAVAGQYTTMNANNLPLLEFSNNVSYGPMDTHIKAWWIGTQGTVPYTNAQESVIDHHTCWGVTHGCYFGY